MSTMAKCTDGRPQVYVGIVGGPGAGKRTFINSIRRLTPKAPGAAAGVGLHHTISVDAEYPHPARQDSLIFVDFPSVLLIKGTEQERHFDMQQYLNEFGEKMEQCQVFLLFSNGHIQHNAVQIGMKAREMGKKVLFVRSQFDKDLEDKWNDHPTYFIGKTKADLMEELRQDYISVLKNVWWEGEVNIKDVFIISGRLNYVLEGSWDIPNLCEAMNEALQKMVFINNCSDFSKASTVTNQRDYEYRGPEGRVTAAATASTHRNGPSVGAAALPGRGISKAITKQRGYEYRGPEWRVEAAATASTHRNVGPSVGAAALPGKVRTREKISVMAKGTDGQPQDNFLFGDMDDTEQGMLRTLAESGSADKAEILKKIQKHAAKKLETWENQKVYVGIVGDPGAGKSTFINSIRGLRPEAPRAAEVGLCHTTSVATEYPHPARPDSLIFVDFPGVLLKKGTGQARDFDIQQYLQVFEKKMKQCHVFLVFSSGRIQHNPVQIGMKAREMGKKVLFVRSQFDKDLADMRNDKPKYFDNKNEVDLMEELRQDYIKVLKDVGWKGEVNVKDVFIISGRLESVQGGSWDIPKFRKAMIQGLDALQKMVVINTCRDFSKATIKERGDVYRGQAWRVALAATAGTLVPFVGGAAVPGACAIAYKQYKEGFGLTGDALKELAKMTNKRPEDLKSIVTSKLVPGGKGVERGEVNAAFSAAAAATTGLATVAIADQVAALAFPIIGAVFTAPMAIYTTYKVLNFMISMQEQCATDLIDYAFSSAV